MKWPTEINVLGKLYAVKVEESLTDDDGKEVAGLTCKEEKWIKVEKEADVGLMWQTLFHEVAHAWMCESGVDGQLSDDLEESVVISIERHLVPIVLELVGKSNVIRPKKVVKKTKPKTGKRK